MKIKNHKESISQMKNKIMSSKISWSVKFKSQVQDNTKNSSYMRKI